MASQSSKVLLCVAQLSVTRTHGTQPHSRLMLCYVTQVLAVILKAKRLGGGEEKTEHRTPFPHHWPFNPVRACVCSHLLLQSFIGKHVSKWKSGVSMKRKQKP